MYNKDKMLLWRRLLLGAAVCTMFCMTALSPSRAAVCLLSEGNEGCQGDPGHYTSTTPENNFNCQAKGFEDSGNGNEWDEYGTFSDGGRKYSIDIKAAKEASDWPNEYRVSGYNDSEHAECVICHRGAKVIEERDQSNRPVYYFRCNRHSVCGDGYYTFVDSMINSTSSPNKEAARAKATFDTASLAEGTVAEIEAKLKEVCSALDYKNASENNRTVRHFFKLGTTYNDNYVCGKCEESVSTCANGRPASEGKPAPARCYQDCVPTGEQTLGYDENGTPINETCCEYPKVEPDCSGECLKAERAIYDHKNPKATNAGCTGWGWNDENASQTQSADVCSCYEKPCQEGDTIKDNEQVKGPNLQGYFWVKKEGKCFAKIYTGWSGNDACYKEVEMSQETGSPFKCADGTEFDAYRCECMPMACPDGWSMYAHSVDANGTMYNEKIGTFLLESNGASLTAEAAAANCGDGTGKSAGWTVQTTEDGTPEGRTFFSIVEGEARNQDGTLKTHQCGKCVKKACGKIDRTIYYKDCSDGVEEVDAKTHAECNVDPKEVVQKVEGMFSGDEQCYYCPYCFSVDEELNRCKQNIDEKKLRPCIGAGVYPPEDDEGVTACTCDDTLYYRDCQYTMSNKACPYDSEMVPGDPQEEATKGCKRGRITGVTQESSNIGVIKTSENYPIIVTDKDGNRGYPYVTITPVGSNTALPKGYYVVNTVCPLVEADYPGNQVGVVYAKCTAKEVCYGEAPAKDLVTCKTDDKNSDTWEEFDYTEGPRQGATPVVSCGGFDYYKTEDCKAMCERTTEGIQYTQIPNCVKSYVNYDLRTTDADLVERYGRNAYSRDSNNAPIINGTEFTGSYVSGIDCSIGSEEFEYALSPCKLDYEQPWNHPCDGEDFPVPYNYKLCDGNGEVIPTDPKVDIKYCGGNTYYSHCDDLCFKYRNRQEWTQVTSKPNKTKRPKETGECVIEECEGTLYMRNDTEEFCLYKQCELTYVSHADGEAEGCVYFSNEQHEYTPFVNNGKGVWYCPYSKHIPCYFELCGDRYKDPNKELPSDCKIFEVSGVNNIYCKNSTSQDVCLTLGCQFIPSDPVEAAKCNQQLKETEGTCYVPYGSDINCNGNQSTPTPQTCGAKEGCSLINAPEGSSLNYGDKIEGVAGKEFSSETGDWYYVSACEHDSNKWYVASCIGSSSFDCSGQTKAVYKDGTTADKQKTTPCIGTGVGTPAVCAGRNYYNSCKMSCTGGSVTREVCEKVGQLMKADAKLQSDGANVCGTCTLTKDGETFTFTWNGDYGKFWNDIDSGLGISNCVTKGWCKE